MSVPGVSEVASVGGFVQEYQIDVDPDRCAIAIFGWKRWSTRFAAPMSMWAPAPSKSTRSSMSFAGSALSRTWITSGIRSSNLSAIRRCSCATWPTSRWGRQIAGVPWTTAAREAVGGVVVVRYGENPLAVIQRVKQKIEEISLGLPTRTLPDGTVSQVRIVPFYDRTDLIHETLDTLRSALSNEILVTIIVVIMMMVYLRSALLISALLPLAVLICFIAMKIFEVDANIVALSGIAIAIGTMVDMGIIIIENIFRHVDMAEPGQDRRQTILRATREVGGAVLTAVSTTIVSFLPVFTLVAAEGKLFRPLAFTKTFALAASLLLALVLLPLLAYTFLPSKEKRRKPGSVWHESLLYLGGALAFLVEWRLGLFCIVVGGINLASRRLPTRFHGWTHYLNRGLTALAVVVLLSEVWHPLGHEKGAVVNFAFVVVIIGGVLGSFRLFQHHYTRILSWCLGHKAFFLSIPLIIILLGGLAWRGYDWMFGWMPRLIDSSAPASYLSEKFPGLGREFMPPLEEGSYLYMPVTMPHASIGEVLDIMQRQDRALETIPEVEKAVGKLGRAESPLDPAPISMIETLINYRPEYLRDSRGRLLTFRFRPDQVDLFRAENGRPLARCRRQTLSCQGPFRAG